MADGVREPAVVTYRPCAGCDTEHLIVKTTHAVVATSSDGSRSFIPGQTVYLRVGNRCYIPTLSGPDDVPVGHDKTLTELWELHDLAPEEWLIPYTGVPVREDEAS